MVKFAWPVSVFLLEHLFGERGVSKSSAFLTAWRDVQTSPCPTIINRLFANTRVLLSCLFNCSSWFFSSFFFFCWFFSIYWWCVATKALWSFSTQSQSSVTISGDTPAVKWRFTLDPHSWKTPRSSDSGLFREQVNRLWIHMKGVGGFSWDMLRLFPTLTVSSCVKHV